MTGDNTAALHCISSQRPNSEPLRRARELGAQPERNLKPGSLRPVPQREAGPPSRVLFRGRLGVQSGSTVPYGTNPLPRYLHIEECSCADLSLRYQSTRPTSLDLHSHKMLHITPSPNIDLVGRYSTYNPLQRASSSHSRARSQHECPLTESWTPCC